MLLGLSESSVASTDGMGCMVTFPRIRKTTPPSMALFDSNNACRSLMYVAVRVGPKSRGVSFLSFCADRGTGRLENVCMMNASLLTSDSFGVSEPPNLLPDGQRTGRGDKEACCPARKKRKKQIDFLWAIS